MLQLLRMVTEENFRKTEEEHRKLGYRGIDIWYGYNNYDQSVSQINSIARANRKEKYVRHFVTKTLPSLGSVFY